jgi:predicted transcriptional regulator
MITLRLPKELEHEIDRLAKSEHQTRTEIIKQALRSYLARQKRHTPYELGIDLFGAGESGDRDLSTRYKVVLKEKLLEKHAH